jgi:hypothetical protein
MIALPIAMHQPALTKILAKMPTRRQLNRSAAIGNI